MLEQAERSSGHRSLAPDEIIRLAKERHRICRYLFVVASLWVIVGGLLYFLWLGFDDRNSPLRFVSFVLQMIGFGVMSVAFAVQRAIYRCPVCDACLGNRRNDNSRCSECNANIKEPA
jgi:hypothetical protein